MWTFIHKFCYATPLEVFILFKCFRILDVKALELFSYQFISEHHRTQIFVDLFKKNLVVKVVFIDYQFANYYLFVTEKK